MRRGWWLLLVLSLGLNAGLLVSLLAGRSADRDAGPELPTEGFPGPPAGLHGLIDSLSHHCVHALGDYLRLDDDQRERMTRLRESLVPSILAEREEVRRLRRAIHRELETAEMLPDSIAVLAGELSCAQARLDSLVLQAMLQEAGLLSLEQRQRYFGAMQWGAPPRHPPMALGRGRHAGREAPHGR